MQLEQHLFSIYRTVLKLPKALFLISALLLLVPTVLHVRYILNTQSQIDNLLNDTNISLNQCLIEYIHAKYQEGKSSQNITQVENSTSNEIRLTFLDELTILHIRIGQKDKVYEYELNYSYSYGVDQLPQFRITETQALSFVQTSNLKYLKDHGISFDLITIPKIDLQPPIFTLYSNTRMNINELLMQYFRNSLLALEYDFNRYKLINNMTNTTLRISPLALTYFYGQNNEELENQPLSSESINFNSFVTFKLIPIFFHKIFYGFSLFILLMAISMLIGLMVRYVIITFFTIFLMISDRCLRDGWGWTHQYLLILYNRYRNSPLSTFKMMVFYMASNVGIYAFFIFGSYCIIRKLIYPVIPLVIYQYNQVYLKTCFFIEIFHFTFSRSRVTLKFFPIISFAINFTIMLVCSINQTGFTIIFLNINLFLQLSVFFFFLLIEKTIMDENEKGLMNQFCPSNSKPRMLFYAGYDISWEKSLPPLWTYFTRWFDYSYFNDNEKCLIEKDYQLLYGRMLGLNDRQEIPQEDSELLENTNLRQPSNEMNLIQD